MIGIKKPHWRDERRKYKGVFTARIACVFLLASPTLAQEIRCPDWEYLVAKYEGRAALRSVAPSASFDELIGRPTAQPASATVPKTPLAATKQPLSTQATQCTYSVKKGDTLHSIARKSFGEQKRWKDLLRLNASKISNKDILRVGQTLKLPCEGQPLSATAEPKAPPIPVWTAKKGERLTDILKRWSTRAGYELIIETKDDWIIASPVSIEGAFRAAVKELIKGLATSGSNPPVRIFSNNTLKLGS